MIALGAPARADDRLSVAPDYLRIRSIQHAGSGRPAGSVAENVSPDRTAFTVLFDSFIAEIGPGLPLSTKRKNCQLLFDFDYPSGWQFALLTLDSRGYVSLERGVSGTQKVASTFRGSSRRGRSAPSSTGRSTRIISTATCCRWRLGSTRRAARSGR